VPFEKRYPPGWVFDPDVAIPKMEFAKVPMQETWIQMENLKEVVLITMRDPLIIINKTLSYRWGWRST
jgi:hypothetical protein